MDSFELTNEGFAVIKGDTHLAVWVKEHKTLAFDTNALPYIMEFIKEGDIVVDAGANIGCYSYAFKDKAKEVICFEPNPDAFDCLKYNLSKFPNVFLMNVALGSRVGYVNVVKQANAGATFVEYEIVEKPKGCIQISTLDRFNLPKVDFIKIDVEGFELALLQGGIKTITRDKPKLYIEINEGTLARCGVTPKNIFEFLDNLGYQYRNIYPNQKMEGEQYDIICW